MEQIVFQKTGPIDGFIEWLERFKGDISKDSIVIEVDLAEEKFICKTFTQDKSLVRYSQISFSDANFKIEKISESSGARILVGIFTILPKFIDVVKTFSTTDKFTLSVDYDTSTIGGVDKWVAFSINFKSYKLKMKIPGSSINAIEMDPLSDETFNNRVWIAPDPVSITLSSEMLKNLIAISDIFIASEKLKNFMEFYTKDLDDGKYMFVRDSGMDSYDYELGKVNEGSASGDVVLPIYRERFLLAVKNAFEETTLTISTTNPTRVLIELKGGNTKTIIAKVNR